MTFENILECIRGPAASLESARTGPSSWCVLLCKKSEILKIIREEVEVVLTNEEAEEIFDLDVSALLDEMTTVDEIWSGAVPKEPAARKEDKSFSKAAKEIEKKGTEGVFTAKADKAGMGVQAYAAKVLKKGSKASTKTKRQAAFAKGAATVARENK